MTEQAANALDGLVNLRDLGGLPTDDGASTRAGVVYRSDAPHAGDRDPEGVAQWPPRAVIDLRDTVEQGDQGHPLAPVSTVHRVPLLEDVRDRDGGGSAGLTLSDLYDLMVLGVPKKLVEVFRIVLDTEGPVLIHCAAGKDRTGVASALLLRAAGVRADAIVADYVRTDPNMQLVLKRLDVAPVTPPGVDDESVNELISAPAEAIERVLSRLETFDGGAAGFLRAHGVTADEVRRWQERFLS